MANQAGDKWAAVYGMAMRMNLSKSEILVGMALVWHSNARTGRCDPSIPRIADEVGLSVSSVERAIKGLKAKNIIVTTRHGGGNFTNAYDVQWKAQKEQYQAWLKDNGLAASIPDKTVRPPLTKLSGTPVKTEGAPPQSDGNPPQN